jgi:hypothetical protein
MWLPFIVTCCIRPKPVTVQDLRENPHKWLGEMDYLRKVIRETIGRDLPIAITEVNSDPSSAQLQDASPDSFYNAIWYADVLGQMMNADVFMLNQWSLSQRSGGLGLIQGTTIRPSFYVFPLTRILAVNKSHGFRSSGCDILHPSARTGH